ncbi:hypothetical protein M569_14976 [Genlisea aurea]|uniref:Uncharacterized protein n=1 Tax=Genlisea aurea TaxID=192259 RepID=S8C653_9LAMI|nr:hypothetical protein M569_14976 [Genlisea aurea]
MGSFAWSWISNLLTVRKKQKGSPTLKEKALAVAARITPIKDGHHSKASCPVCFSLLRTKNDADDLATMLAVHLTLWHPEDVNFFWDMQRRRREESSITTLDFLSTAVGIGMGLALAALLRSMMRLPPIKK